MTRALVVHSGNIVGGVERVLASMVGVTRARGTIDLEIALVFDGPVADTLRGAGACVHVIGPARVSRPLSVLKARRRLAAVLVDRAPVAAITQSAWTLGLFGGVIRSSGVPLVHWVHDTLGTGHWVERLGVRHRPEQLICNSAYSASCAATVFPGVPHAVLYAPLDRGPASAVETRDDIRRRLGAAGGTVVIAQVGRTEPLKGHRVLVDALGRLKDDPRWTCWQVGAPQSAGEREYWSSIEALARERGLGGRVRFLGAQADVLGILAASDIYCQPNIGPEAFGLTLVEAMWAGLPVVTSAVGAAPEVLQGTGNLLTKSWSVDEVASALRCLLDDPALRARLGGQGVDRARTLADGDAAHRVLSSVLARVAPAGAQ
jgi:glycosyltransferase involved in cell wall biosynthesis